MDYPKELYQSPIYHSWSNMKRRCDDPKNTAYSRYGGRGIKYTKQWAEFSGFYKDMGETYKTGLTLDRIDNSGDYTPDNCRWATYTEQANNRRSNKLVTIDGVTKTLEEWVKVYGLKSSTVRQRIYGYGWGAVEALTTPLMRRRI